MLLVPRVHTLLDPRFHGDDRERDEDERERDGEVTKKKTQMTQRFYMHKGFACTKVLHASFKCYSNVGTM
jgi:hypothetical protein